MLQKLRSYIKARKLIEEDRIEVTYEVKLSYKTSFQIWIRDKKNIPKRLKTILNYWYLLKTKNYFPNKLFHSV